MTHSIHHSEGYAVQRLSMRSLFIATAITTGLAYFDLCSVPNSSTSNHDLQPSQSIYSIYT